ncbi:CDP-alcohol phosphatidyltransferase family protein [candidate division TA06 bacterium]|nr:CDP-alcohol phosphatidyltransferase family protein [candidate division TA06 bacterium]
MVQIDRSPFSRFLKLRGRKVLQPVVILLVRSGIHPHWISGMGLLLSLLSGIAFWQGSFRLAGILLAVGGIFDTLDGEVAKASNKQSRFGAFLDSTLDRYGEFFLFFGIFLYYTQARMPVAQVLTLIALFGSLLVSYLRARSEGIGEGVRTGPLERPERILLLLLGTLAGERFFIFFLWALAVLAHLTAFLRIREVWKRTKKNG